MNATITPIVSIFNQAFNNFRLGIISINENCQFFLWNCLKEWILIKNHMRLISINEIFKLFIYTGTLSDDIAGGRTAVQIKGAVSMNHLVRCF